MRASLEIPTATGKAGIDAALEGLVRANMAIMRRSPVAPLYESGVKYRRERPGRENWDTVQTVYRRGTGDCEDLSGILAASLRLSGEDPGARAVVKRSGPNLWHCVVRRSNGRIEDPSRRLGMGTPEGNQVMAGTNRGTTRGRIMPSIGRDASVSLDALDIRWGFTKTPDGSYRGWITLPAATARAAVSGGQACTGIHVEGVGISAASAMRAATGTANAILSNPIVQSMLPPGTLPVLRFMNKLARRIGRGARRFFRRLFRRRSRSPRVNALRQFAVSILPAVGPMAAAVAPAGVPRLPPGPPPPPATSAPRSTYAPGAPPPPAVSPEGEGDE